MTSEPGVIGIEKKPQADAVLGLSDRSHQFPDEHSSRPEYAARFNGKGGAWLLAKQRQALDRLFDGALLQEPTLALDVGGGHGQVSELLIARGYSTVVVSSTLKDTNSSQRPQAYVELCAPLAPLPLRDRSFTVVVTLRILPHMLAWREFCAELCRVADQSVIFDYPRYVRSTLMTRLLFRLKRAFEGNTRPYLTFTDASLDAEMARHGFFRGHAEPQFLLPQVVHRALNNPRVSEILERSANLMRSRPQKGSPVIVRYDRQRNV